MTMKKRITSFALVLLMVLSSLAVLLPVMGVKTAAAEKTYTKVTAAPDDWTGTYLIVYEKSETEGYVFNGLDATGNYVSATITKSTTSTTESIIKGSADIDNCTFTIGKVGSDYSIKLDKGNYIGRTANKNGLDFSDAAYTNTITFKDNVLTIKSSGGPTLQFYSSGNSSRFRYYASGQQAIQLYKLDTGSTPTEPDVPAHEGDHTYGEWTSNDAKTHSCRCTIEGCKETKTEEHEITWTSLDEKHTGKCKVCGYATEGAHNWVTDTEATDVPDGKLAQKCSECGATRTLDTVTETIDFTKNFTADTAVTDVKSDNFTLTFAKGSGSNAPKYYTNGTAVRIYGGNTLTIKGDNGLIITKIKFTFGSSDGSNEITADSGTYEEGTWTGSKKEVTFTIGGTKGNRRIMSLEITCEAAATKPDTSKMIDSATLNIGTNIDVNYYVTIPAEVSYEKYVMRFTLEGGKTVEVEGVEDPKGLKFTFKGIGPHQMGLKISAELYGVNGETETKLSEKTTYSVKENLESLLKSDSETVRTLAENMLIYGAAAQKYNKADDSELVTDKTHDTTPSLADTNAATVENIGEYVEFVGMVLYFDSEPRLAINYKLPNGVTETDVTFTDGAGNTFEHKDGYVYLTGVTADQFAKENKVVSSDGSTVTLSVNTYIYYILKGSTNENMKALATALYYYGVAAEAYVKAQ